MMSWFLAIVVMSPAAAGLPAPRQESPQQPKEKSEQTEKASQTPPSLAEIAQRAREKREKAGQDRVKVVTNASIRKMSGGNVSTSAVIAPRVDEQDPQSATATAQEGEFDLEAFKQSMAQTRMDYITSVNQHHVLQLRMNDLRNRFFSESDGSTQARFEASLNETMEQLAENKKLLEQFRMTLDNLEKQGRTAGLDPADLRKMVGELPEPKTLVDEDFEPDPDGD